MLYADTDFFLALLKENDWLRERALKVYKEYHTKIFTSAATVIELLLLAKRFGIDPERLLVSVFALVPTITGISQETALVAAHYIKEKKFNVFDAVHAAYCGNNQIISSDHIYDTVGMERIKLEG